MCVMVLVTEARCCIFFVSGKENHFVSGKELFNQVLLFCDFAVVSRFFSLRTKAFLPA